jgi:hypothetical protein
MHKILIALTLVAWSTVFVCQVNARPGYRFDHSSNTCRNLTESELEWDSNGWGVGGKVFRDLCKGCHHRGNDKDATFLWVESKTPKGWNRVFAKQNVKCAKDGSWSSMTMTERLKLNDYLFRWAYASAATNCNV